VGWLWRVVLLRSDTIRCALSVPILPPLTSARTEAPAPGMAPCCRSALLAFVASVVGQGGDGDGSDERDRRVGARPKPPAGQMLSPQRKKRTDRRSVLCHRRATLKSSQKISNWTWTTC
jgi:hypothetical protein